MPRPGSLHEWGRMRTAIRTALSGTSLRQRRAASLPQEIDTRAAVVADVEQTTMVPSETVLDDESPFVEITGLELLHQSLASLQSLDDEETFESYARDSIAIMKANDPTMQLQHMPRPCIARRRLSNCSSLGFNESFRLDYQDSAAYLPHNVMRRLSMGSTADDSADYGRYKATRRSSIGSNAKDSVDFRKYKATRRGSMESYANDSVDFGRYFQSRRSSLGNNSSANNSHDRDRVRGGGRRSSLGVSNQPYSFATPNEVSECNSLGMGTTLLVAARTSLGMPQQQQQGHETEAALYNRYAAQTRRASVSGAPLRVGRRASLGTSDHGGRRRSSLGNATLPSQVRGWALSTSQHQGVHQHSFMAQDSMGVSYHYNEDSLHGSARLSHHDVTKRRLSNASCSSAFSHDVFETQSINTNGTTRAA